MTELRRAAEMALEVLLKYRSDDAIQHYAGIQDSITFLRQALAQPEQEPFEYWNAVEGWVTVDREEVFDGRTKQKMMQAAMKQTSQQYRDDPEVMFATGWYAGFHSRTTGPKREWVGLTADEIWRCNKAETAGALWSFLCAADQNVLDFAKAIETKLKEKNA